MMAHSTIDIATLQAMLEQKQPVTVLDVRPAADRAEWFIPGSIHIDAYEALKANDPDALAGVDLPADQPVVTVCGAGKTSVIAAEQLRAHGLPAFSLAGGMKAWSLAWNQAAMTLPGSGVEIIQVRRTGKGCLSYLVGAKGEAAVIDASLDPTVYLQLAEEHGWTIRYVLDTHIHADHLSRSRQLAEQSGATLYLPAQERVSFPFTPLWDGDKLNVGGRSWLPCTRRDTPRKAPAICSTAGRSSPGIHSFWPGSDGRIWMPVQMRRGGEPMRSSIRSTAC
jgi:rhodanese-related sulfurtransferase